MSKPVHSGTRTLISPVRLNQPGGRRIYRLVLALTLAVATVVFIGPLYWMATGGFKSSQELVRTPPTLFPENPGTHAFTEAWDRLGMGQLLLNTVVYAGGALLLQLVFCVAAAYSLSKLRPIFGNVILGMMLASMMIPAAALVIPQYLTVLDLPLIHVNLLNTPWVIWLPTVANAFNVFLLKRFFDSIPNELLDAASIDGAGPLRVLWSVILPLSRPILGVVSIFGLVAVWKDFLWPLITVPAHETLNVGVNTAATSMPQNTLIAGLFLASLPTIALFLVFQRNIMAGLTAGSLKG
ncbi:carbohydrate ABC transporter membrane protein 2 (CUT1 family) [Kitasatospora sp. SolWspMP-SS2h]|uniref:carbohydrate ABC transporter permease n=1 Tax=Kitasatospora sp. SolWspMP-SS2h TaxID=1305729 RepID=UPI000DBFCE9C|nr:carbohydrate ABC transporter permease [Kitasatospora sp. SolWspMP-SS2h]RAJ46289.1 carbohydrate ABC transporter membrane protein 2 (CUT1 family) [Kitasatospora sp. SolWspMP-SS2h]